MASLSPHLLIVHYMKPTLDVLAAKAVCAGVLRINAVAAAAVVLALRWLLSYRGQPSRYFSGEVTFWVLKEGSVEVESLVWWSHGSILSFFFWSGLFLGGFEG